MHEGMRHSVRGIRGAIILFALCAGIASPGAPPQFEKVGPHCYYLPMDEGKNVGAVVTEEGILMVNPPAEDVRAQVAEALRRISSKAVRWVVFTDPRYGRGARHYAEEGAQIIASARQQALSARLRNTDMPHTEKPETKPGNSRTAEYPFPWLVFQRQAHVFPSNVDVRLLALQNNARTGGDVVVHVPDEKVLFVGDLYESARYPDIDAFLDGSAKGWFDGMNEVIRSIPLLKPAIPQQKPGITPGAAEEKTLEEGITVVSAQGKASNLQNMKDLLDAAQKLRNDISRAFRAGRSTESYLNSPGTDRYRAYGNFEPFAALLFEILSR